MKKQKTGNIQRQTTASGTSADTGQVHWNTAQRQKFLSALQVWSEAHGRALPWRNCGDPYRVWLSEIMLQQTTVAAVIPYFERFLSRFPTLAELATAPEQDVLRLWEGLGYYSRARNLHKAANVLCSEFQGQFPSELDQLHSLPGVGRYTAGAIASFGFDLPAPIVEANTQRLYARLLDETADLKSTAVQRRLWTIAEELVTTTPRPSILQTGQRFGPGAINQALMDLGATVCTPQQPRCDSCPVARWCGAFASGRQHEIPRLPARPTITELEDVTVAIQTSAGILLRQRQPGERWAGLWDFPRYTLTADESPAQALVQGVQQQTGLHIQVGEQVAEVTHSVTRYRIRLRCYLGQAQGGASPDGEHFAWVAPDEFHQYALSVTGRKFATVLKQRAE